MPIAVLEPTQAPRGVKRPGHVDHSTAPSADVKNKWSYTSTPLICLHGADRDDFALVSRIYFEV